MYAIFEKLCKEKGISSYRVSKDTGIATATLSDWKNGKSHPKADKIQILADYFGVSPQYISTGVENIQHQDYYTDEETAKIAQEILEDRDLHALLDSAKGNSPENLRMVSDLLKKLKGTNPDG